MTTTRPKHRWNLDGPTSRARQAIVATGVALAAFLLLLATAIPLPIVWDEGDSLERADHVARWTKALPSKSAFSAKAVHQDWIFTTEREGHPALLGWIVAVSKSRYGQLLPPLLAARAGPMLLFAMALGAVFFRLWRDVTFSVAAVAVCAMLTMPRLFAHAHFALWDSVVTSTWLIAWAMFRPALENWRWSVPWGVALGATLSAKFTGWLAPLPFLAWAILYRDRRALRALAIAAPVALVVFWALNPPLWHAPLHGVRTFFYLNLHRGEHAQFNISTLFLGRMYNLDYPLPWYNTLVWTAITILPFTLVWGVVGMYQSAKRWRSDPLAVLVVLNWLTLIVVRALPWAPPHDAERLILPSFAFFAILAAIGVGRLLYRNSLLLPEKICAQRWVFVLLAIGAANGVTSLYRFAPQWLSYYSPLVGGLPGADALGFEPTYYWDSLDGPTIRWLNEHTGPEEWVEYSSISGRNLELLRRWKILTCEFQSSRRWRVGAGCRWYVLQRRESAWSNEDYWLINNAEPAYQKRLSGVPLLEIYNYADFERAEKAIQRR